MRNTRGIITAFAASLVIASCSADAPVEAAAIEPTAEEHGAPEPEPEPPPTPPASDWLHGEFEFRAAHVGHDVRLGVRFDGTSIVRTNQGVATATESYTIVSDAPERVVLEIAAEGSPTKVRELLFDGPDVLMDAATPDVRYLRVAAPIIDVQDSRAAGGSGEGSGP